MPRTATRRGEFRAGVLGSPKKIQSNIPSTHMGHWKHSPLGSRPGGGYYDMVIAWEQKDHDFARKMAIINEQYQNVECVNDMFM